MSLSSSSSLWQRIIRVSKDGYHLLKALSSSSSSFFNNNNNGSFLFNNTTSQQQQPPLLFQSILVEQANVHSNSVAKQMLQMQREYGLLQYHGIYRYLQDKFPKRGNTLISTQQQQNNINNKMSTKAKIAFMITSSMKSDLMNRLGYDSEQIKTLTPIQASLILNHDIMPNELETKLPKLQQEYEEEQKQQQEETLAAAAAAAAAMEEEEEEESKKQQEQQQETVTTVIETKSKEEMNENKKSNSSNAAISEPTALLPESKEQLETTSSSTTTFNPPPPLSPPVKENSGERAPPPPPPPPPQQQNSSISMPYASTNSINEPVLFGANIWYEVLEHQNGKTNRVGLHQTKEEADFGMKTRLDFAERDKATNNNHDKGHTKTYSVQSISREDLL